MQWEPTIRISDILIAIATITGPIAALWIQRILSVEREQKARRVDIFRRLMVTRSRQIAADHVDALNLVPLEFFSVKAIQSKFDTYLNHLNTSSATPGWLERRADLFSELLFEISKFLGYTFGIDDIKRGFYVPQGHFTLQDEQERIRKKLLDVLEGRLNVGMDVKSFPFDAEAVRKQIELQGKLGDWLSGESTAKVRIDRSNDDLV